MKFIKPFAIVFLFCAVLFPKTLILPFQVDTQNHAAYQWLGKAVSFYLISGLSLNLLDVTTEEETQFLLKQGLVLFPFGITKATAITLARQNQADYLLWGKILNNAGDATGSVTIKMFLIDIPGQSQRYLPLIKGDPKDLFLIQNELLRHAAKALGKKEGEIEYPDLGLTPADYEKFIKSLLLSDGEKKMEWLMPLTQRDKRSDFVNWELAKTLFDKGDYVHTDTYLKKISENRLFDDRKNFLLALNDFNNGQPDLALEQFIELQKKNVFEVETENNLGVLYLLKKNFTESVSCLERALRLRKNPDISFNYIQLLVFTGMDRQAAGQLTQALLQFPDDRRLLRLLFFLISRHPDKETLFQVFRTHTPIALLSEEELKIDPVMQNPFGIKHPDSPSQDAKPFFTEARSMFLEDDVNGAQEKIEQVMEINPFMAESHQLLSMIYLKKGELPKAEAYGLSSLFLKESPDIYQLLIKIYQASNNQEKIRKIRLREQNQERAPGGS